MYWISKDSVLEFGGATYRYGDKLPDGVSESFVEKGKASLTAPSAPTAVPGEVELLKERLAEAGRVANEMLGTIDTYAKELVANKETIEQLRTELTAAQQTIEQLTAAALPAGGVSLVVPAGAGPKEGKK